MNPENVDQGMNGLMAMLETHSYIISVLKHTMQSNTLGKSKVGNHPIYELIHILSNSLSAVESAQGISDYPNK